MNTNPDETMLALWLDDELEGADLASVETWALTQPEQLAARDEIRRWRATMAAALPASEEPHIQTFSTAACCKQFANPRQLSRLPHFHGNLGLSQ
jgi:hypothetical protein